MPNTRETLTASLRQQEAACKAADVGIAEGRKAIAYYQNRIAGDRAAITAKRAQVAGLLDVRRGCRAEIRRLKRALKDNHLLGGAR